MKDQFNGNTEKRCPPPYLLVHELYEMVKDIHVVLGKWKRIGKFTEEDHMWKKQSVFWELAYWKDLDVCHSIYVMHVEKNVRADLKKMGIRPELWLDDSVKGTKLLTSCITLSKHEKEFCGFLKM
jgi:hypothetical protein